MKSCKGCKESLPLSEYYFRKTGIPYTLCKLCYLADRKKRDLSRRHDSVEKECNACHVVLPVEGFSKNRSGKLGRCETCKSCVSRDNLRIKYGIVDIEKMVDKLDGKCQICSRDFSDSRWGKPAVDHDHSCCSGNKTCGKCVRGLLCSECNHGLGKFQDSEEVLMSAIEYLRGYRESGQ